MNKSHAYIVSYTLHGERVSASAARISTTSGNAKDIFKHSTDKDKNTKLIGKVLSSGHKTILEHMTFFIAFSDVSAAVEQFLIEYRLLSFTIKSRRYVNFGNLGFVVPNNLSSVSRKEFKQNAQYLFDAYNKLIELDIPKEDARFVLPYCFRSNFYCTVNARELLHIIDDIINGRGSQIAELQSLAEQIIKQTSNLCPSLVEQFNKIHSSNITSPDYSNIVLTTEKYKKGNVKIHSLDYNIQDKLIFSYHMQHPNIDINSQNTNDILNKIIHANRAREIEQVSVSYTINNISLAALTHLERHRMHSLIIPELPIVDCGNFILPSSIKNNAEALKIYKNAIKVANSYRTELIQKHDINQIYFCLAGNTTNVMTTMNLHELRVFFSLRCCNRAQWEIRELAQQLLSKLHNKNPLIFDYFGASCKLLGYCPEGKMTCGNPSI